MPLEPLLVGFAGSLINWINGMQGAIGLAGRSIQEKKAVVLQLDEVLSRDRKRLARDGWRLHFSWIRNIGIMRLIARRVKAPFCGRQLLCMGLFSMFWEQARPIRAFRSTGPA
jgi:hypothetical protein